MELREKIAQQIAGSEVLPRQMGDEAWAPYREIADRILALPEIAEALASYAVVMARTLESPERGPNP